MSLIVAGVFVFIILLPVVRAVAVLHYEQERTEVSDTEQNT